MALKLLSGEDEERSPYSLLRDWLSRKAEGRRILAVVPKKFPVDGGLWLRIMFERRRDAEHFKATTDVTDEAIARQFRQLIADERSRIQAQSVHVSLHAFDEEYVERMAGWLTDADKSEILSKCEDHLIWKIRGWWGEVVFFFHTDEQLRSDGAIAARTCCQSALDEVIARYDQFGYLNGASYPLRFDSRETFKRDFNENWFNYDH